MPARSVGEPERPGGEWIFGQSNRRRRLRTSVGGSTVENLPGFVRHADMVLHKPRSLTRRDSRDSLELPHDQPRDNLKVPEIRC
jgi:hypothetical protein